MPSSYYPAPPAHRRCRAGESDNIMGYKSCSWNSGRGSCDVTDCWASAVAVMASCPEFYPDLGSSFLGLCDVTKVKEWVAESQGNTAYTRFTFELNRTTSGAQQGGCSASHGACSKDCGDSFNALWDEPDCQAWMQEYTARSPTLQSDMDNWVQRCDVRRPELGNWLMIGGLLFVVALLAALAMVKMARFAGKDVNEDKAGGIKFEDAAKSKRVKKQASSDSGEGGAGHGGEDDI